MTSLVESLPDTIEMQFEGGGELVVSALGPLTMEIRNPGDEDLATLYLTTGEARTLHLWLTHFLLDTESRSITLEFDGGGELNLAVFDNGELNLDAVSADDPPDGDADEVVNAAVDLEFEAALEFHMRLTALLIRVGAL